MCYCAIFLIVWIHQKEISVDRMYIAALSFREHGFEGGESSAISLEGIYLD